MIIFTLCLLALFCLGKSGTVCFHSVGNHGLPGACKETLLLDVDTRLFHDLRLHNLYMYSPRRFQNTALGCLFHRAIQRCHSFCVVQRLEI